VSGADRPYVLVGGWPGSGKTTLARALATQLGLAYLGKDDLKESLWQQLGAPTTVEESRWLGEAAVHILLRLARDFPGAVIDSTWYDYTRPLVAQLSGPIVEVRCLVSVETARPGTWPGSEVPATSMISGRRRSCGADPWRPWVSDGWSTSTPRDRRTSGRSLR
jgi:hypothetical protein